MKEKFMVLFLVLTLALAGVMNVRELDEKECDFRKESKYKQITGMHLRRFFKGKNIPRLIKSRIQKMIKKSLPWKDRSILGRVLTLAISSCGAIAYPINDGFSELGKIAGEAQRKGCWHTSDSGATKEAYSDAVYRETWPSSADGAYGDGDTITGDMSWSLTGDATQFATIENNKIRMITEGTTTNYLDCTSLSVSYKQAIVFDAKFSQTGANYSGMQFNKGGTVLINLQIYGSQIQIQNDSVYANAMANDQDWHKYLIIPDFINGCSYLYIDGEFKKKATFRDSNVANSIDRIRVFGIGNYDTDFEFKNFKVADSFDNIGVHFFDTLNEDTLSDYTLSGDTNPTYDATEKAMKLYDDTDADNKYSQALQQINTPYDKSIFKSRMKIGLNDTSTDNFRFYFLLRSISSPTTFVRYYGNGTNIYFNSSVNGVSSGSDSALWSPSANTWYDIELIMNLNGTCYLFIDGVEYCSISMTARSSFYDSEFWVYAQHDAGEVSEVYVKDILIEDAPTVNAPRSTPPGLLTSSLRPAVEGTEWADLAGAWEEANSATLAVEADGIYGNNIKVTDNTTDPRIPVLAFDSAVDMSKYHSVNIGVELDNVTDLDSLSIIMYDSSSDPIYYDIDSDVATVDKRHFFTVPIADFTATGDITDVVELGIYIDYSSAQAFNLKISDIQFLGGPEHHILGQPLYKSPWADGVDDTPEATLGGDTAPAFDTDRIDFDEVTNADNKTSEWSRSLNFNPNGVGHLHWEAEILATDTSTDIYWYILMNYDVNNELRCWWDHNSGTPRIITQLESGGTTNYGGNQNTAKDNNSNVFDLYFHKSYGLFLFMNNELIVSDTTINGSWSNWDTNVNIQFYTLHDAGEESHVKLHSVEFNRHPLNVHRFQSNELEELTDTLSPSGTDYMDGDWPGTASVSATGNPVTNGKYIYENIANFGDLEYTLDGLPISPKDVSSMQEYKLVGYYKSVSGGGARLHFRDSDGEGPYNNLTLTADTWTRFEVNIPYSDDPVGDSGWDVEDGTYDPTAFSYISIENRSGGDSVCAFYGLQIISSEYDNEDFIPQTIDDEWDDPQFGSFYMGPGEKARIYKMLWDGYLWLDQPDLTFLDLWGAGIGGAGTARATLNDVDIADETGSENHWKIYDGSFDLREVNTDYVISDLASVSLDYSNLSDPSSCSVISDSGTIDILNGSVIEIYAGILESFFSELVSPLHGRDWDLKDGILTDDMGTYLYSKKTVRNGASFYHGVDFTEVLVQTTKETGGTIYIDDNVDLISKDCEYNGSRVLYNTTGAAYGIDSIGTSGSWTVINTGTGIGIDSCNVIDGYDVIDDQDIIDNVNILG